MRKIKQYEIFDPIEQSEEAEEQSRHSEKEKKKIFDANSNGPHDRNLVSSKEEELSVLNSIIPIENDGTQTSEDLVIASRATRKEQLEDGLRGND